MLADTSFRDIEKARRSAEDINEETGQDVVVIHLDLSDLESVARFAKTVLEESRLDILVNNAGVLVPVDGLATRQGFEVSWDNQDNKPTQYSVDTYGS